MKNFLRQIFSFQSGAAHVHAVVLVHPTPSDIPLIKAILSHGLRPVAIVTSLDDPMTATLQKNEAHCLDVITGNAIEEIIFQLGALHYDYSAVIPGSATSPHLSHVLAAKLGVPQTFVDSKHAHHDQIDIKWALAGKGLRIPQHTICPSIIHAVRFARKFDYPVIIKPRSAAPAYLTFKCTSDEEIQNAVTTIKHSSYKTENTSSLIVAEEHLSGTEYILNIFADGQQVHLTGAWETRTTEQTQGDPLVHDLILRRDIRHPHLEILTEYAIAATKAAGIIRGAAHARITLTATGPVLMELSVGFAHYRTSLMTQIFGNFDPYHADIEVYTRGNTRVPAVSYSQNVRITSHPAAASGIVARIEGIEKIKTLKGYVTHSLTAQAGQIVSETTAAGSAPLTCWFAHESQEAVRLSALIAHNEFRLQLQETAAAVPTQYAARN